VDQDSIETAVGAGVLRRRAGASCATIPIPLDYAADPPALGTVVIIPGGPGQSSLPLVDDFREVFQNVLTHYDLVVFDARGTCASGVLNCPDLQSGSSREGAACT
jgi:pimeloyl-ACP methyl ester carboxylesterase